jgi:hypothetical protein
MACFQDWADQLPLPKSALPKAFIVLTAADQLWSGRGAPGPIATTLICHRPIPEPAVWKRP